MTLFKNIVKVRGFLGRDAEVPASDFVTWNSYAVLALCVGSGTWKKATNEWVVRTDWIWVICRGPFFCGFTRGMKQGDYIEIEGELRGGEPGASVEAHQIRRLDLPSVGVDEGYED